MSSAVVPFLQAHIQALKATEFRQKTQHTSHASSINLDTDSDGEGPVSAGNHSKRDPSQLSSDVAALRNRLRLSEMCDIG